MIAPDFPQPVPPGSPHIESLTRCYIAHTQPNAELRTILDLERHFFPTCQPRYREQRVTILLNLLGRKVRVTLEAGMIAAA